MPQSYQWTESGNSCTLINPSLSVSLQNSKFTLISQILIQKHRVLDVSSSTSVTPFSYLYARPLPCSPFLNPFRVQHPMLVPSLQYLQLGAPKSYRFWKTKKLRLKKIFNGPALKIWQQIPNMLNALWDKQSRLWLLDSQFSTSTLDH